MRKSKNDRVKLSAAELVLDRVMPRITRTETEDDSLRLVISSEDTARLLKGLSMSQGKPLEYIEAEFLSVFTPSEEEPEN
jgi:hypothetical protein